MASSYFLTTKFRLKLKSNFIFFLPKKSDLHINKPLSLSFSFSFMCEQFFVLKLRFYFQKERNFLMDIRCFLHFLLSSENLLKGLLCLEIFYWFIENRIKFPSKMKKGNILFNISIFWKVRQISNYFLTNKILEKVKKIFPKYRFQIVW